MKTRILTGLIVAGVLATSTVQAATPSSFDCEALYSGLSTGEVQKIHVAAEQGMSMRKSTCSWHEAEAAVDHATAAYLGEEDRFLGEKDYLAAANQNFAC